MKLRTSFFKKGAIRKDITRFAPLWAVYFIGGLLVMLALLASDDSPRVAEELGYTLGYFSWINMIYAGVVAQVLFGDLFNSRMCNAIHAMPLRREQWFVTHILTGLSFSAVPHLVAVLFLLPRLGGFWYTGFLWWLAMLLQYVFFFGVAVFSCLCVGNRVAMVAMYSMINFASPLALSFIQAVYEPMMYGIRIDSEPFQKLCPVINIIDSLFWVADTQWVDRADGLAIEREFQFVSAGWTYCGIIAVIGVGLLVAALFMYRRRALETAGDFIAVRPLTPIFSLVFTLMAGAVFAVFGELVNGEIEGFLFIGMILGFFVGQMLLQRKVKVFKPKTIGRCAVVLGLMLASILVVQLDILGIETWVPKASEVKTVTVSNNTAYYVNNSDNICLTDESDIALVIAAHKQIADAGELDTPEEDYYIWVNFYYEMENGMTMERSYRLPSKFYGVQTLKPIYTRPQAVLGAPDLQTLKDRVFIIHVADMYRLDVSQSQGLLEALWKDCEAGVILSDRYAAEYDPDGESVTISFEMKTTTQENGIASDVWFGYRDVLIDKNAVHTRTWLQEHQDLFYQEEK